MRIRRHTQTGCQKFFLIRVLPVLAAVLLLLTQAASADPINGENPFDADEINVTWQELNVGEDEKLLVFSAPFDQAERAANGKAAVSVREPFRLLGTLQYGAWGMVDYEIDGDSGRIGWIRMPEAAGMLTPYGDLSFARVLMRTTRDTYMTDDPLRSGRKVMNLPAGETVIGMFTLAHPGEDWVYAEAKQDGTIIWGFVPADATEDISSSLITTDEGIYRIAEGVTILGGTSDYTGADFDNGGMEIVSRIEPGDIGLEYLDLSYEAGMGVIRQVILPESLRRIGMEGISFGRTEELRLTGNIAEIASDAMYALTVGRMILAADYTGPLPDGYYLSIGEWKAEDGNPVYRDIDGVLYSADGKTLLNYPNLRKDTHYDVPAGTEEIGDNAFRDSGKNLPLRSISLPIGLKRIGKQAFSGCAYLISMAVPLTVKEIDPSAFAECVSLERLSLPTGMSAELSEWVKAEDFSCFHGDNGGTLPMPAPKEEWETEDDGFSSFAVRIDNETGSGTVPVYEDESSMNVVREIRVGRVEWVSGIRNGRACLGDGWIDLKNAMNDPDLVFFTITDAKLLNPVRDNPDGGYMNYVGLSDGQACFSTPTGEKNIPVRDTILYRTDGGKTDRAGIIVPEQESVSLLDQPDGQTLMHLYPDMQVRIIAEDGSWLKVETGAEEGWVPRNAVQVVMKIPE